MPARYASPLFDKTITAEPVVPTGKDWVDTSLLWRSHRLQYRGWHVLHAEGADRLWNATRNWFNGPPADVLNGWPQPTALFVIRELVWRTRMSLRPLNDDFVFTVLDPLMKRFAEWRVPNQPDVHVVSGAAITCDLALGELDEAYDMLLEESLRHSREIGRDERFLALQGSGSITSCLPPLRTPSSSASGCGPAPTTC